MSPSKRSTLSAQQENSQRLLKLLLAIWDLETLDQSALTQIYPDGKAEKIKTDLGIRKTIVIERSKKSSEKSKDYEAVLQDLESQGAIVIQKKGQSAFLSLGQTGRSLLGSVVNSVDLVFETSVGARLMNTLIRWIREEGFTTSTDQPAAPPQTPQTIASSIASYDEFKEEAMQVLQKLNTDYQLSDTVPIYRLRRSLGDRIDRTQFNEWLLAMHRDSVVELMSGTMPDLTPDIVEDSVTNPLGLMYYYANLT